MAIEYSSFDFSPSSGSLGESSASFFLKELEAIESLPSPQEGSVLLPSSDFLLDGTYVRSGEDLLITSPDGETFEVEGYFSTNAPPILKIDSGALLTPETVETLLTGPNAQLVMFAGPGVLPGPQLIGKAASMLGKVTAKSADGQTRVLKEGEPIYKGDVLKTEKGGLIKVVFEDKTEFQLGEDARVVLNKYVYNPDQGKGSFEATVVKGMFRYASGNLSHLSPGRHSVIKTPTSVIGIRGSELQGEVAEDGSTTVVHLSGVLDISDALGEGMVTLLEPGEATSVMLGGGAPKPVFQAPASFMAKLNAQMDIAAAKEKVVEEEAKAVEEKTTADEDGEKSDEKVEGREAGEGGSEGEATPEEAAPDEEAPEEKTSDEEAPEEKTSDEEAPEEKTSEESGDKQSAEERPVESSASVEKAPSEVPAKAVAEATPAATAAAPTAAAPTPAAPTPAPRPMVPVTQAVKTEPVIPQPPVIIKPPVVEPPPVIFPPSNSSPTGSVVITGTLTKGSVLAASHSTLADADQLGNINYQWQLQAHDSTEWTNITGANTNTLTLTQAEIGNHVRVELSYLDGNSTLEKMVSAETGLVLPTGTDGVLPMQEDAVHSFDGTAFGFSISENNSRSMIKVLDLPQQGHLEFKDKVVEIGDEITLTDLNAGHLRFVPVENSHDANNYATFSYQVGFEHTYNTQTQLLTFQVMPVNDAPLAQGSSLALIHASAGNESGLGIEDLVGLPGLAALGSQKGLGEFLSGFSDLTSILDLLGLGDVGVGGLGDTPALDNLSLILGGFKASSTLNAEDIEGDTLTYRIDQQPAHGTIVLDETTGAFTYTPGTTFSLTDQFTFRANDGTLDSPPSVVNIKLFADNVVIPDITNNPPTGAVTVVGDLIANSILTTTHTLADADGLGELFYQWQRSDDGTGAWTDISNANASTFTLTEAEVNKHVRVVVSYTDGHAVAEQIASVATTSIIEDTGSGNVGHLYTTQEDVSHAITGEAFGLVGGTGNDNLIQVKVVELPQAGTGTLKWNGENVEVGAVINLISLNAGRLVYQPEPNGHGENFATTSFLVGNAGNFNPVPVPVTFTVLPTNDDPIAQDATVALLADWDAVNSLLDLSGSSTNPDLTELIALTAGMDMSTLQVSGQLDATDVDGDVLTFTIKNQPSFGTIVLDEATGSYTYSPSSTFLLEDTFTFLVNDGTASSEGTVTVQFFGESILFPATDPVGLGTSELGSLLDLLNGVDSGTLSEGATSPRVVAEAPEQSSSEESVPLDETGKEATELAFDFGAPMEVSQSKASPAQENLSFDFFAPDINASPTEVGGGVVHPPSSSTSVSLTWDNAFSPTESTSEDATRHGTTVLQGDAETTLLPTVPEEEDGPPAWHLDAQSISLG